MRSSVKYPKCHEHGLNVFHLSENFTRAVIWADEVESHLQKLGTPKKVDPKEEAARQKAYDNSEGGDC